MILVEITKQIDDAISEKTKMIIINSPNNQMEVFIMKKLYEIASVIKKYPNLFFR